MSRTVIVSAVRTPFGKLGGGLKHLQATELGAIAIRAGLERAGVEGGDVDYVIMGQVLQGGAGQAPARQAAVGAGIPIEVPADTINKVCASSIRAVEIADSMIRAGDADLVVTGGMESMSNAPYILKQARFGYRLGDGTLIDLMTHDGLISTFDGKHMVEQASFVSRELGIAREDQDRWALRSQERAAAAQDAGRFDDEIVPVGEVVADESVRRDTTYRAARSVEAGLRSGRVDDRGKRAGRERRCVVCCRLLRGVREEARPRSARDRALAGLRRGRVRLPRAHAGESGGDGARACRPDDRRCAACRAERGLRIGRGQLDRATRCRSRRPSM